MQDYKVNPYEIVKSIYRHRKLIHVSVKREIAGRYKGSIFGLIWVVLTPVIMLSIYAFVFSEVFNAKWGVQHGGKLEFSLILFVGLIVFNIFGECISRAPGLIASNANYVKKVIFPLELLPIVTLFSSLYHAVINLAVWLIVYSIFIGPPEVTFLLLPIVIIPLAMIVCGLSWFLCSLGVYIRDISQIIGLVITGLMFLSPIFYPITAVPDSYRVYLEFNPLMPAIEMSRELVYWGRIPDAWAVIVYWIFAAILCWAGFAWFQKTRKGFADVI